MALCPERTASSTSSLILPKERRGGFTGITARLLQRFLAPIPVDFPTGNVHDAGPGLPVEVSRNNDLLKEKLGSPKDLYQSQPIARKILHP